MRNRFLPRSRAPRLAPAPLRCVAAVSPRGVVDFDDATSSLPSGVTPHGDIQRHLLLAVLLAAALCGCGGDEPAATPAQALAVPWVDPDGELPVVGSLSVNPADGVLWMATNTGLFRVREGARPERVTGRLETPDGAGRISAQLVVAFAGPDTLLASGHPAADQLALPSVLGLVRSTDAGRTWTPVSEQGTADFHAIRPAGDVVAAALYGESQALSSRDGGRTWKARATPRVLVDLVVDPGDPERWVASAADGVWLSRDGGGTWRPVDPNPNAYLAWPEPGRLYRLDPGGPLFVSADGGTTWRALGDTGGEPRALTADGPERLYAALLDGTVRRSRDGGRTWDVLLEGG